MTWVDLVVLAVLAVSALLAFMRGLVREVLGIGAWVAAVVVAIEGLPFARPIVRRWLVGLMLGVVVIALFLTDSRGSMLSLGTALVFIAALRYRRQPCWKFRERHKLFSDEQRAACIERDLHRLNLLFKRLGPAVWQVQRHAGHQQRRRDHEDDQQHQHDIDHRRDVDLRHWRTTGATAT